MTNVTVRTTAELSAAVSNSIGGETIYLAPGNYSSLAINSRTFAVPITITSLDRSNKAHIDHIKLSQAANVTISELDIGRALAVGEVTHTALTQISSSRNIVFDSLKLHGSLDGNPGNDGILMKVLGSDGVTIRNSELTEAARGVVFEMTDNILVSGNHAHLLRSDGFDFAGTRNVVIEKNRIGGFFPAVGDHADAIQFFTMGQTTASANITIRNNVLLAPSGTGNQGIWINDEVGTVPFTNVSIENNFVYSNGGAYHGISVSNVIGGRVSGNTVVSTTSDSMRHWVRLDRAQNVDLTNNVSDAVIVENSTDVRASQNIDFRYHTEARLAFTSMDLGSQMTERSVYGTYGYQIFEPISEPTPTPTPEPAPTPLPMSGLNLIYGTAASETVRGTTGHDKIWGIAASGTGLGKGTVDALIGSTGADVFVVGDARGVFYNDGRSKSAGRGDYARILDFESSDKIQINGTLKNHLLKTGTVDGESGTQIFLDTNRNGSFDSRDELIALVVGVQTIPSDAFILG